MRLVVGDEGRVATSQPHVVAVLHGMRDRRQSGSWDLSWSPRRPSPCAGGLLIQSPHAVISGYHWSTRRSACEISHLSRAEIATRHAQCVPQTSKHTSIGCQYLLEKGDG